MSAVREWAASQNSKLLEVSVFFSPAFLWQHLVPWLFGCNTVTMEMIQAVAVNNLGKWKTATQMTALTILLATRDSRFFS